MFLTWLLKILKSERGETPDTGTVDAGSDPGGDAGAIAATDTSVSTDVATQGEGEADEGASGGDKSQPGYKEGFMAPKDMPDEIKGHFGKMLSTYQKKLAEIEDIKENAEIVKNFWNDSAYAKQVLTARAKQLGMTLTEAGIGNETPRPPATVGANRVVAPDKLVKEFETRYGEGREADARADADMFYASILDTTRAVWAPMQQKAEERQKQIDETQKLDRESELQRSYNDLSQKYPGWEENEDEMDKELAWLESGVQNHPVYGNRLQRAYQFHQIIKGNGDGQATAEAVRRIGAAGNNKTNTGRTGSVATINIDDRLRKAGNLQAQFKIATDAATEELRREGITVPD